MKVKKFNVGLVAPLKERFGGFFYNFERSIQISKAMDDVGLVPILDASIEKNLDCDAFLFIGSPKDLVLGAVACCLTRPVFVYIPHSTWTKVVDSNDLRARDLCYVASTNVFGPETHEQKPANYIVSGDPIYERILTMSLEYGTRQPNHRQVAIYLEDRNLYNELEYCLPQGNVHRIEDPKPDSKLCISDVMDSGLVITDSPDMLDVASCLGRRAILVTDTPKLFRGALYMTNNVRTIETKEVLLSKRTIVSMLEEPKLPTPNVVVGNRGSTFEIVNTIKRELENIWIQRRAN